MKRSDYTSDYNSEGGTTDEQHEETTEVEEEDSDAE